jgi:hypothetical protein
MQNGTQLGVNHVYISNALGNNVATFNNVKQFNISNLPAGLYWYRIVLNGIEFSGKLLKL